MTIFLQSAGTNVKQKKVQGPMPKSVESARTNYTFKPLIYMNDNLAYLLCYFLKNL